MLCSMPLRVEIGSSSASQELCSNEWLSRFVQQCFDGQLHDNSLNHLRHPMKRFAYASFATMLLVASVASFPASPSSRPVGVSAEEWVAVNDRLGIVLVRPTTASRDPVLIPMAPTTLLLPLRPPVDGYFMVRTSNGWVRLVIAEPAKGPADAG